MKRYSTIEKMRLQADKLRLEQILRGQVVLINLHRKVEEARRRYNVDVCSDGSLGHYADAEKKALETRLAKAGK